MDMQPKTRGKRKPIEDTQARPMQPGDGADTIMQDKARMAAPESPMQQPAVRKITEDSVREAYATMEKYKAAKAALDTKIIDNELWYKLRHGVKATQVKLDANGNPVPLNSTDPDVTSAWLLNSLMGKHADAMDNYPTPAILPREEGDKQYAEMLTGVLPAVLEQNEFEQAYSDVWWYKLKSGTGAYQVLWDASKLNGIGDITVRKADLLNLYWEPGISDIQKSHHLFHVELAEVDDIKAQYPDQAEYINSLETDTKRYVLDDAVPTDSKVAVFDWYYKRLVGTKQVLHYCKFACGRVLYASENDPELAERGFYDHGKYPFIFDVLYPEEGTPYGFGFVDICKNPQMYIDKLDSLYVKHAAMSRPRYFARNDMQVNQGDMADFTKEFVDYEGSANPNDAFVPVQVPPLDGNYIEVLDRKINELKETSGNRDFSQGSTASGVTAASAIAALQEAGSKTSRDVIKGSYRAFQLVCVMCIDLMRQFYTEPRYYRITGQNGDMQFAEFNGQAIGMQQMGGINGEESSRMPYFDIKVVAQKASPFSTVAQNERAKEFYGLGFFSPDRADQALACLSMMQFEGIEQVRQTISRNGTLFDAIQQLAPIALLMAQQLDATSGTMYAQQVAMIVQKYMAAAGKPALSGSTTQESQSNALGEALNGAMRTTSGMARKGAASLSTPKA